MTKPPNENGRPFDAAAWLERVDAAGGTSDGFPTGFPSIDHLLGGGFRRGDLVVAGGDCGAGTSALAMAIALKVSAAGLEVALFSSEFSLPRLFERAVAMEGKVRIDDLRHARLSEEARVSAAAAAVRLRDLAPTFATMPPTGLAGLTDLLIDQLGLDLLVIDSLESLARGQRAFGEELALVTRTLKSLAVQRSCTVLLVAHTLPADGRADPRPGLPDFGADGAIRHEADVVLGLFREEMYALDRDVSGAAEVHVLKNRNGATGYADLWFHGQWVRFEDVI